MCVHASMCVCGVHERERIALLIQYATRWRRIVYDLSGSTTFFDITSQTARFSGKVTGHKICVLIFSTTFIRNIFRFKKISARYCHKCENVFT